MTKDSAVQPHADQRSGALEQAEPEINPLMHLVAPIVAIGATMIVRKMMNSGYRRVTGNRAPDPHEPGVTFTRALVWAVATAATAAAVEVAVYRLTSQAGHTRH